MFCSVSRNGNPHNKDDCLGIKCFLSLVGLYIITIGFKIVIIKFILLICGDTLRCVVQRGIEAGVLVSLNTFLLRVSEAQMNTIKSKFVHKPYNPA